MKATSKAPQQNSCKKQSVVGTVKALVVSLFVYKINESRAVVKQHSFLQLGYESTTCMSLFFCSWRCINFYFSPGHSWFGENHISYQMSLSCALCILQLLKWYVTLKKHKELKAVLTTVKLSTEIAFTHEGVKKRARNTYLSCYPVLERALI